ncbi:MAG TPA: hypothetical protein VJ385_06280, partial [Fibrobacteria bacterium]|nr:hypothetical protein [Fibrobacteria bacterium]
IHALCHHHTLRRGQNASNPISVVLPARVEAKKVSLGNPAVPGLLTLSLMKKYELLCGFEQLPISVVCFLTSIILPVLSFAKVTDMPRIEARKSICISSSFGSGFKIYNIRHFDLFNVPAMVYGEASGS